MRRSTWPSTRASSSACSAGRSGACGCDLITGSSARCSTGSGRDVSLIPDGETHFFVSADVVVSPQFFAWVYGFGAMAQIIGPADVVEQMRGQLADVARLYKTE